MRSNVLTWCLPIIAGIVLIPTRAKADSYSYNISNFTTGAGIASGRITVAPANGKNKVTVIQGTILNGGFKIDLLGVNSFGNNDNTLTNSSPYLDSSGISFVANNVNYNVAYQGQGLSGRYILTTGGPIPVGQQVNFYVGPTDTVPTPEPPLVLLLATGFAGLIFVFRRKLQLGG